MLAGSWGGSWRVTWSAASPWDGVWDHGLLAYQRGVQGDLFTLAGVGARSPHAEPFFALPNAVVASCAPYGSAR